MDYRDLAQGRGTAWSAFSRFIAIAFVPNFPCFFGGGNERLHINADLLMRLRPNRCVFGAPRPYPGKGRPAKHGQKMKLSDSTTWGVPIESIEIDDPTWGRVEIKRWSQFHFYGSPDHPMEIILIQRQGKGLSKKAGQAHVVSLDGVRTTLS